MKDFAELKDFLKKLSNSDKPKKLGARVDGNPIPTIENSECIKSFYSGEYSYESKKH